MFLSLSGKIHHCFEFLPVVQHHVHPFSEMPAWTLLNEIQSPQRPLINLINFANNPGNLLALHNIGKDSNVKSELLLGSSFAKELGLFKVSVMAVAGAQNSVNKHIQL